MKLKHWIFGTVTLLAGASGYLYWQYKKFMDFDFEIKNFKLLKFTKDRLLTSFVIIIDNPSIYSADIINYDIKIYINSKHLGKVLSNKKDTLKAKGKSSISITADLNPQKAFTIMEIIKLISYATYDKSKLIFDFKGTLKIKKWNKAFDIPIDIKYSLQEMLETEEETKTREKKERKK